MLVYRCSLLKKRIETQAIIPRPLPLVSPPNPRRGIIRTFLQATSPMLYQQKNLGHPRRKKETKASKRNQLIHRHEITTIFSWAMSLMLRQLPIPSNHHLRRRTDPLTPPLHPREAPERTFNPLDCSRLTVRSRVPQERKPNLRINSSSLIRKSITISSWAGEMKRLAQGERYLLDRRTSIRYSGTLKTS